MDEDPAHYEVPQVADIMRAGTPVRVFRPFKARGWIVYLHGGGWVMGTLDTYEDLCQQLAVESGCFVAAVDYSLAPAVHHPTQIDEVWAVMRWMWNRMNPVALAGDGVGAHLALQVAARAAREDRPLWGVGAIYPIAGPGSAAPAVGPTPHWPFYLGETKPSQAEPPVGLADLDLRGLPPTMVVEDGGTNGAEVTEILEAAGVEVTVESPATPPVDFLMPAADTRDAVVPIAEFLSDVLTRARTRPPASA